MPGTVLTFYIPLALLTLLKPLQVDTHAYPHFSKNETEVYSDYLPQYCSQEIFQSGSTLLTYSSCLLSLISSAMVGDTE